MAVPVPIRYMGTKKDLVGYVHNMVRDQRPGAVLDLFAGMCSVAQSFANLNSVWANDVQAFANLIATSFLCDTESPPKREDVAAIFNADFSERRKCRFALASQELAEERTLLEKGSIEDLRRFKCLNSRDLEGGGKKYSIFERNFGSTFFGRDQAIEIDLIRESIDVWLEEGRISTAHHSWLLIALAIALGRCSTTTGHFAQPLAPSASNFRRFKAQRLREIKAEWLRAIESLDPPGSAEWKGRNRVTQEDAVTLLRQIANGHRAPPEVIYADPPYTKDQYSRYYHVYETLVLYDYPAAIGAGRYREGRITSEFSMKSKVYEAIKSIIDLSATIGKPLLLSYPKYGLLASSEKVIPNLFRSAYGESPLMCEVNHRHSTLGASKGKQKLDVIEVMYLARIQ